MELVEGKLIRYGDALNQIGTITLVQEHVVEGVPLEGGHFMASIEGCSEASEADVERWNAAHNDGTAS